VLGPSGFSVGRFKGRVVILISEPCTQCPPLKKGGPGGFGKRPKIPLNPPSTKGDFKGPTREISDDCFQLQVSLDADHKRETLRQLLPSEIPEAPLSKGGPGGFGERLKIPLDPPLRKGEDFDVNP
jgi:hypothetical protein